MSTAYANIQSGSAASGADSILDLHQSFIEQRQAIERDLADGETYSEISSDDRKKVKTALDRISSSLAVAGGLTTLDEAKKAELFNDQELVNAILTQAGEDSRLVCTREKKVGSHRTTTNCMTVAERRRAREQSQDAVRQNIGLKAPVQN
ncbi:hypothetical protein CSC70_05310 [Pseudoxanthomonas kalamensis DSM 18571]|nr:hypothetical protein CSC70_05310 [Pseudoxanthomonas kalamensis DSM 18571]